MSSLLEVRGLCKTYGIGLNKLEVLSGIKPGDKVVTSSYDNFGEVDKLIIKH